MTPSGKNATMPIMQLFSVVLLCISLSPVAARDDNLLAHRLFESGDYVQAGEIFTDPAWKGVALYRSEQWWRAAEAFVRANDPVSAFNLGNCYVKLGYYALALDAYQRALSMNPSLKDADHNAQLMRKLLTDENNADRRGARQPTGDEIERIDSEDQAQEQDSGEGGDQQSDTGDSAPSDQSDQLGEQRMDSEQSAQAGDANNAIEQPQQPKNHDSGGALNGQATDQDAASQASGGSESDNVNTDSQAAGLRTSLETEQATTQWLNRINHDAQLYLQQRIKLEQRRRQAAGQSAPEGGSSW